MNDLVIIHPYDGDMDERVLEEVKPRYVIMSLTPLSYGESRSTEVRTVTEM
jgi:hypothetical protein